MANLLPSMTVQRFMAGALVLALCAGCDSRPGAPQDHAAASSHIASPPLSTDLDASTGRPDCDWASAKKDLRRMSSAKLKELALDFEFCQEDLHRADAALRVLVRRGDTDAMVDLWMDLCGGTDAERKSGLELLRRAAHSGNRRAIEIVSDPKFDGRC